MYKEKEITERKHQAGSLGSLLEKDTVTPGGQFCRTDTRYAPKGQGIKMKDSGAEYFDRMECVTLHLFVFVWGLFSYPFILGNISSFSLLRFLRISYTTAGFTMFSPKFLPVPILPMPVTLKFMISVSIFVLFYTRITN